MKPSLLRGLSTGALLLALLPLSSSTTSAPTEKPFSYYLAPLQGPKPDPAVLAQFGLYSNATLQKLIDTKGQQMNKVSDRPGDYGFTIVDSPVINAFATPDGHVYFTRGIMAYFNNEAQFAGVLGHELGHITARHGQKQQTRSTISSILLGVGSVVSPGLVGRFAQPLSQVVGLGLLKYGRDAENEADVLGVKYSTKIGYDAANMADFFQTLQRTEAQSGAGGIPTFLSTHPNSADRYTRVKGLAAQAKQQTGSAKLAVNRDSYLRSIEGLPFGEDPRQGFVEGGVFYHPDLKFRFPVPSGWKTQNSPEQFQMAEPNGKALIALLPAPGNSLDAAAEALVTQLKLQSAQASRTTINGFPAVAIQADQVGQDQSGQQGVTARTLTYLIQDGQSIFALIGLTSPSAFGTYSGTFSSVAQGFSRLTDASKLNRQPEKIRIKTVKTATTLGAALAANGIPTSRREDMAILNGMQLTTKLPAGTLFKVVGK
ncbi:M48 family metalloprotease [Hymenobacter cellulosivorans]|uniref:M48 family metalloprotease n=1 Tax=Hymenobacter cellulosivorans TaxID=2932249 RepID=A0ABY4F738_9BACT|nr:M48 family metalloprotease [Hymenobacter cellulosivorans]UOQ52480.1 M48 family metalloprotease [Hymenobacter cellulosivorans]